MILASPQVTHPLTPQLNEIIRFGPVRCRWVYSRAISLTFAFDTVDYSEVLFALKLSPNEILSKINNRLPISPIKYGGRTLNPPHVCGQRVHEYVKTQIPSTLREVPVTIWPAGDHSTSCPSAGEVIATFGRAIKSLIAGIRN